MCVSSFTFKARTVHLALQQEALPSHQAGTASRAAAQGWSPSSADEEEGTAASILRVSKCVAQGWYKWGRGTPSPSPPAIFFFANVLNFKKMCFKCSLNRQVGIVNMQPHVVPTHSMPPAGLVVRVRSSLLFCLLSPSSLTWCTEKRPC